jgi:hypothetical protein
MNLVVLQGDNKSQELLFRAAAGAAEIADLSVP